MQASGGFAFAPFRRVELLHFEVTLTGKNLKLPFFLKNINYLMKILYEKFA